MSFGRIIRYGGHLPARRTHVRGPPCRHGRAARRPGRKQLQAIQAKVLLGTGPQRLHKRNLRPTTLQETTNQPSPRRHGRKQKTQHEHGLQRHKHRPHHQSPTAPFPLRRRLGTLRWLHNGDAALRSLLLAPDIRSRTRPLAPARHAFNDRIREQRFLTIFLCAPQRVDGRRTRLLRRHFQPCQCAFPRDTGAQRGGQHDASGLFESG